LQVAQDELEQDEQLLLAPPPPRFGDDEWTANFEKMRLTSGEAQRGQRGFSPLRTSSSNGAEQALQTNS
jgi:hypothetical protein